MARILVFGDSITQGYHDSEGGWVERLRREVLKNDKQAAVFNLGISGDKIVHVLNRFDHEVEARTKRWDSFDTSIIVLDIGANDTYKKGQNPEPVTDKSTFIDQYARLIDKAKTKAKHVLVCTILPFDESRSTPVSWVDISYFNEIVDDYNLSLKNLCSDKGVTYADINSEAKKIDWNSMLDDGTHPTNDGHQWICDQIKPVVIKLLSS